MRTIKKKKKTNDLKIARDPSFRIGDIEEDDRQGFTDPGPVPKRLMDRYMPNFDKVKEDYRRVRLKSA